MNKQELALYLAEEMQQLGYLHVNHRIKRRGTASETKRTEAQVDLSKRVLYGGAEYRMYVIDGEDGTSDQLCVHALNVAIGFTHTISADLLNSDRNKRAPTQLTPAYNLADQLTSLGNAIKYRHTKNVTLQLAQADVDNIERSLGTAEECYRNVPEDVESLAKVGELTVHLGIARRSAKLCAEDLRLADTALANMRQDYLNAWLDNDAKERHNG